MAIPMAVCLCVCLHWPDEQMAVMLADKVQELSRDKFEELKSQLKESSPSDNHKKVLLGGVVSPGSS